MLTLQIPEDHEHRECKQTAVTNILFTARDLIRCIMKTKHAPAITQEVVEVQPSKAFLNQLYIKKSHQRSH